LLLFSLILLHPGPFFCALCCLLRAALFYQSTYSLKRSKRS
jgi:hypothetical protein